MKFILGMVFIIIAGFSQQSKISEVRSLYKEAAQNEKAAEKLLKLTSETKEEDPLMHGYHGGAQMMMAKHVGNPFKKISHFNRGKAFFSEAIELDPNNVELRFLRFTVQAETPGFLNYKQDLAEDKSFLLSRTITLKDPELRQMILAYLLSSEELSSSEKENII